ncbi:MAG: hypothetical protein K0R84_1510, partial [Clostridia bacterium]|nr:hypothetical protein [Clostridia bacterium]
MFKRHFLNGKVTVLLILSLFMIGCASPKANDVKSDFSNLQSLKVSIFPSSRNTKTYLFRFSSDNALEVLFGERNNDDIESKNY